MKNFRKLYWFLIALLVLIAMGTAGFHYVEQWSWFDSLYMVVITFSTVGYGEVHPLSQAGRVLNVTMIMAAMSWLFLAIGTFIQTLVGRELRKRFGESQHVDPALNSELELHRAIRRIVNSEEFTTALRPILPKGAEDKKFGFDYIPFLLRNIDKRRVRFKASSQLFLINTIILAIVFSSILAALGYVLVNESAAGDPYRLSEINRHLNTIKNSIPSLTPRLKDNEVYQRTLDPIIIKILDLPEHDSRIQEIQSATTDAIQQNNLGKLQKSLDIWLANVDQKQTKDLTETLKELQKALDRFRETRSDAEYFVFNAIDGLKDNISQAQKTVDLNRTPELLKRMAIGFVVATFFLAILRYIASLYREHYRQMVLAEQDDLSIRRFYIAFRAASEDKQQRIEVLARFVSGTATNEPASEKYAEKELAPQSQELIKDILEAIAKRAGS